MTFSRSHLKFLLKGSVSAALLVFLVNKLSIDRVVEQLRTLDRGLLVVGVTVFFMSNVLGCWQWHMLLRASGVAIKFDRAFRFYFVGLFFNNFLPANIGGDAVKIYDVSRLGSNVYQVIAVTLLDRLIGIFSLCLLACVAVVLVAGENPLPSMWLYLVVFVGCMTPVLGFYFIEPLGRLLRRLVAHIRPFSLNARGASILDHLGEFKDRKQLIFGVMVLSLVIQGLRVLTHILVALSIGIRVNGTTAELFFVFVPLLSLAMIPPITINGLGIREALGIVLLAQAGIGQEDAFTIEFVAYLVSVVVSLLGLAFFTTRRSPKAAPTADTSKL